MNNQGGLMNAELAKALRCKECFDLCNVESCRYHITNTKSGCKCAIKLMAADAADALEAADRRIAELKAAQMWISVKERLPDYVGSYLVYYHEWSNGDFLPKYDDYRIRVMRFMRFMNNGKWCFPVCTDKRCEADTNRDVTHWQPLPQPPQKG